MKFFWDLKSNTFTPKKREVKEEATVNTDVMLHEEVYTAEQVLLEEAKRILAEPSKYDVEKHARLQKLFEMGFTSALEVKEFKVISEEFEFHTQLKNTIEYYQYYYPLYRFITAQAVIAVCEKYGLILSRIKNYIGEIPEKNQKEIIQFNILRSDMRYPYEINNYQDSMYNHDDDSYKIDYINQQKKINPNYMNEKINGRDLLILAPIEKLDTRNMEISGHIMRTEIKDPIILQSVKSIGDFVSTRKSTDGYLIATSWGEEASDENVINKINN
jgi:hypothetical protein